VLNSICSLFKLSKLPYIAHVAAALFRLCRTVFQLLFLSISAAQPHLCRALLCRTRQTLFFYICLQCMFSDLFGTISRCRRREGLIYIVRCICQQILAVCHSRHICRSPAAPCVKHSYKSPFWSRSRSRALNRVPLRTDRAHDGTESLKQLKRLLTCQRDVMLLELCSLHIATA